jgi:hypothetical protein
MKESKAATPKLLGDYSYKKNIFKNLDEVFATFYQKKFKILPDRKKSDLVNKALLKLIETEREPCFLLSHVLNFIERVDQEKILLHYRFTSFELWLNQYSKLSFTENLKIRGKIAGKWIPRDEYQILFPIAMGKVHSGTHFVTAHKSPDLDTTIASFWGWLDAFATRVGDGLHIWNLPGGPPESQIEIKLIFEDFFGAAIFSHLVKKRTTLTLTANDLMTQQGVAFKGLNESVVSVGDDEQNSSIILVDEKGYYLGDWRGQDAEGVRQIVMLLNSSLRWFENLLHVKLVSLFAKRKVKFDDISSFVNSIFNQKIKNAETSTELTERQKENLDNFLVKVLKLSKGMSSTFEELGQSLTFLSVVEFADVRKIIDSIWEAQLFDDKGFLIEDRPKIFNYLERIIKGLHLAIQKVRSYLEKLETAFQIKEQVFGYNPKSATVRSDVEELRSKLGSYQYLTITYPDSGKFFPVGVVKANNLRKPILGTVSLRDFCNSEEMTIPSYLDIISVIDHHKAVLKTSTPSMTLINDAQASNALVAKLSISINKRYSISNMTAKDIDQQLNSKDIPINVRVRLLEKKQASQIKSYFIHPEREMIEYLHFLYGILDDTDLLMKVTNQDVDCVAALLNRMKSLLLKKEIQIIDLSKVERNYEYAKKSAKIILQNEDMYSLYKKVYEHKEKEIDKNILLIVNDKPSSIFKDTKEQNGCCRVGQTKMFVNNLESFEKNLFDLRSKWIELAENIFKERPELDLHLHMISTIVSAKEVYEDKIEKYLHKDQLWIWVPNTGLAVEHLKRFLNSFQEAEQIQASELAVEFLGENAEDLKQIFSESFFNIKTTIKNSNLPIAVLTYDPGTINSRKAMISPYLPTLVS